MDCGHLPGGPRSGRKVSLSPKHPEDAVPMMICARVILPVALLLSGCGKPSRPLPPLAEVEGTVKLKQQPLEQGDVIFFSEQGLPFSLKIAGGKYAGKVAAGKNKVQFSSIQEKPNPAHSDATPGSTPTMQVNVIPPAFAAESKEFRDVEAGKKNVLDFEIK